MNNDLILLTKSDLRAFEFSEYLIREICRDLDFVNLEKRRKGYDRTDVVKAITEKLSQTTTKPHTREVLQISLSLVASNSNIIEVDFLQKLSLAERINFLRDRREKIREKGDEILKNVDKLLKKARAMT